MIKIPVFAQPHFRSWPKHEKGGRAIYTDLEIALTTEYRGDAHFSCYHAPTVERRLCYEALGKIDICMVAAVFDVDGHGVQNIDDWWLFELMKIEELRKHHQECFIYRTRGGYRIVALIEPFQLLSTEQAKREWTPLYESWVNYLARCFDIEADHTSDWTREFRLPRATRDEGGSPESLECVGEPGDIGFWRPELQPGDMVRRPDSSNSSPTLHTRRANNAGDGLLHAMLSASGRLHEPVSDGCWRITCPRSTEHSRDTDGTTSTVLWRPRPGEEFGSILCKHSGCGHDKYTLKDWIKCFPQSEIDAARNALNITYEDPNKYSLSDLGNAERMHRDHSDRIMWCPQRRRWYVWNGCIWAPDETLEIVGLAKSTIRSISKEIESADIEARKDIVKHWQKSEQSTRLNAMLELARAEPGIAVNVNSLDSDPSLLCCSNGVLDLRSYRLLDFSKDLRITRTCSAAYRPSAVSPLWSEFLHFVTAGDREFEDYLQRVAGYCLSGTATEKAFFFVYGPPDGCKSTFVRAIGHALGTYFSASSSDTWIRQTASGGNRGDLVRLQGARMTFASEIKPSSRFDEALIKRVTGGDPIVAAAKYEAEVEFTATFKLILAANTPPKIYDDDEGMWSRVQRIPFTNVIPPDRKDPHFSARLAHPDVAAAILAWCVEGHRAWQSEGLGTCSAVARSNESYRREMDRWQGFAEDELVFAPDVAVHHKALREAYVAWCRDNGIHTPMREDECGARLAAMGAKRERTKLFRYWSGVTLTMQMRSVSELRGFPTSTDNDVD